MKRHICKECKKEIIVTKDNKECGFPQFQGFGKPFKYVWFHSKCVNKIMAKKMAETIIAS